MRAGVGLPMPLLPRSDAALVHEAAQGFKVRLRRCRCPVVVVVGHGVVGCSQSGAAPLCLHYRVLAATGHSAAPLSVLLSRCLSLCTESPPSLALLGGCKLQSHRCMCSAMDCTADESERIRSGRRSTSTPS